MFYPLNPLLHLPLNWEGRHNCVNMRLSVLYAMSISPFYLLVLTVLHGIETRKSRHFNKLSSNVYDSVCVPSKVISVSVSGVGKSKSSVCMSVCVKSLID